PPGDASPDDAGAEPTTVDDTLAPEENLSSGAPAPEAVDAPAPDDERGLDLREARAAFEARHIADVLRGGKGNGTRAAKALGLSRAMLQKKMKDYDLR